MTHPKTDAAASTPPPAGRGVTPPHGTEARYRRGCRCDQCRPAASEAIRLRRWRLRERRAGTIPNSITHGASGYTNIGCRCDVCVTGHRAQVAAERRRRRAERVQIDGRLVAVNAPTHGTASTYSNHGCRCAPCTAASTEYARTQRRQP